jgi:hypothetical protein
MQPFYFFVLLNMPVDYSVRNSLSAGGLGVSSVQYAPSGSSLVPLFPQESQLSVQIYIVAKLMYFNIAIS